jgi:diacylglycerol kinase (ATP)
VERLIIILNGISRKKKKFYDQILPIIKKQFDVDVWETKHAEHAIELGAEAAKQNPFGVLAAGGDGTLNQVINGLFKSNSPVLPHVGIIPLGTGNDFARLAEVKSTGESIVEKIKGGTKPTDIGKVACTRDGNSVTRYFINVASLGMGPAVVHELFKSDRSLGADLTYLKAILKVFFTHPLDDVEVKANNWDWRGKSRVVAIGNGQSFGGGIFIAPDSKPDDGLFSTFVAGNVPLLKFLFVLQRVKAKKLAVDSCIHYNTATEVMLTSLNPCWIETEGELAGLLPAHVTILPKAIQFFR